MSWARQGVKLPGSVTQITRAPPPGQWEVGGTAIVLRQMRIRAGRAMPAVGRLGAGVCWVGVLLAIAGAATPALANGAFPDAQQILLPSGKPDQIILATTFGLVISDDGC